MTEVETPARPKVNAHDFARAFARWLLDQFQRPAKDPLSTTVQAAHDEIETRMGRVAAREPLACQAGCAFCCHQQVSATAAEILVIAQRIMAEPAGVRARRRQAIRKAHEGARGLDPMQRWVQRQRCPLLGSDNRCTVYADRPFGCRGYASLDLSACSRAFADPAAHSPMQIPHSQALRIEAVMGSYALEQALHDAGLARHAYDLNHGLTIVLELGTREATRRYLAGEDVLAPARITLPARKVPAG